MDLSPGCTGESPRERTLHMPQHQPKPWFISWKQKGIGGGGTREGCLDIRISDVFYFYLLLPWKKKKAINTSRDFIEGGGSLKTESLQLLSFHQILKEKSFNSFKAINDIRGIFFSSLSISSQKFLPSFLIAFTESILLFNVWQFCRLSSAKGPYIILKGTSS